MASNPKYQPAAQHDPDDYTRAPPAYAPAAVPAAASPRDETQGLFAAPRTSEDNLPDDFKVSRSPMPALSSGLADAPPCSSVAPWPRPPSTSATSSSARSTPS